MVDIKIRNYYYLIAGVLAILFAVTHAWNGQSAVLPMLNIEEMSVGTRTVFTYVWHIITAENLVFGIAFIFMSFQSEQSKIRFAAWMIVAILIVRLMVILGVTALLDVIGPYGYAYRFDCHRNLCCLDHTGHNYEEKTVRWLALQ